MGSERLSISEATGVSSSMLENLQCEKLKLEKVSIPAKFSKEIRVRGRVNLEDISGNVIGLLDSLSCDILEFQNTLRVELDSDVTKSLTKMLHSRVREIIFGPKVTLDDYFLLDNYDGHGRCERIQFNDFKGLRISYNSASNNAWNKARRQLGLSFLDCIEYKKKLPCCDCFKIRELTP